LEGILRTLVIHTAFLGDLILLTPLLDELHQDPDCEWLGLLTLPASSSLFRDDPRLDELLLFDKHKSDRSVMGLLRNIRSLRTLQIDRVVSPHRSFRSALLSWGSGAWERIAFSSAVGGLGYTQLVYDDREKHEIDRNLALLGIEPDPDKPRFPTLYDHPAELAKVAHLFDDLGLDQPIVMAPASVWRTKRWSPSHFGELASMIVQESPRDVLLIGGPDDRELLDVVSGMVPTFYQNRVHNIAGQFGLRESMQILKRSSLAVVNDSAPLHLAQAAGTPTFAIFGSTIPEFGFGPRGPRDRIFRQDLPCVPCGSHGRRRCPLDTMDCMEKTSARQLMDAIHDLLQDPSDSPQKQFAPFGDNHDSL
jgi:heptosyltransferase II